MEEEEVGNGSSKEINNGGSGCTTLEDEIYWSNFKSMRFFISLSADFLSQLMIPDKFSENMSEKLPQMVALKGPGGHSWDVQLVKTKNDTLLFKDGWKEFAKAHHFKENDLLMFKYNRDSCFKVRVFDGKSSCENASSYFVRKSSLKEHVEGGSSQRRKKNIDYSLEIHNNDPYNKEVPYNEEDSDYEVTVAECPPTETRKKRSRRDPSQGSRKGKGGTGTPTTPYTPNIRTQRAYELARGESTPESFLVVMKAGHFGQSARLCIPTLWAIKHLTLINQVVELQVNEKKWTAKFNVQRSRGGVIFSGWSNFAKDNSLQVSDVCVFTLGSNAGEPVVLDVRIFRVSQTPPNSRTPSPTPLLDN